jgi:hypothetical protein
VYQPRRTVLRLGLANVTSTQQQCSKMERLRDPGSCELSKLPTPSTVGIAGQSFVSSHEAKCFVSIRRSFGDLLVML